MENQEPAIRIPPGYTLAIISFILGIFGVFMFIIPLTNPPAITAIALGAISLAEYRHSAFKKGKNLAITGIILGVIGLLIFPLSFAGFLGYDYLMDGNVNIKERVSRVNNDLRTISTGLESYYVDNNVYPKPDFDAKGRPVVPRILTTPIPYLSGLPEDPFSKENEIYLYGGGDLKGADPHNHWFKDGYIVVCNGPDRMTGNGGNVVYPFNTWSKNSTAAFLVPYDPTNGLKSAGDIWRRGPQ